MPPKHQTSHDHTTLATHATLAHPYRTLVTSFAAWKLFLFAIVLGSTLVGDAYDTSGGLLLQGPANGDATTRPAGLGTTLIARLTSRDAIYYVSAARRGYLFEQEWAFGAGLPFVVRTLLRGRLPYPISQLVMSNDGRLLVSSRAFFSLYPLGGILYPDFPELAHPRSRC